MSFGGSVGAMITSLKNNKRTRVSTFDKIKKFENGYNTKVHFDKKASPKELKQISERIKKQNKKTLLKKAVFGFLFLIVVIYFVGFYKS